MFSDLQIFQTSAVFTEFNPTDASVMLDKHTHRSRGFGFVWFADEASREAAIDKHHGTELEGRKISVTKAIPQSQTAPGTPADALRRGHTVPRDQGRVHRNGGDRDRGRDRRYDSRGGGGYNREYSRDRDDRGRDYYRDSYDRDRPSYRSGYDRGYDRPYSGGGYDRGYDRPTYDRPSYDRPSYDDYRAPAYGASTDRYYEPYVPRGSDSSYGARPPPSRYEPAAAAPPSYYSGGAAPPPARDNYGNDRYDRPAY